MATRENLHIVDAITDFPAHVIDNILVHLPLRDAVRTSVLSKEWRYRWTYISELVFDVECYSLRQLDLNDRINSSDRKLERIIYQALLFHQGPINKFVLDAPDHQSSPDIDHWIRFLSNYKVREFTLRLDWLGNRHVMASHFFTFQHLTHLSLCACVFKPPPEFKGFSKLVSLDFRDVESEPAIIARLISRCLLLERVELYDCGKWDSIEVDGPSLRSFMFHGPFKSIHIKNAPLLAQVSLAVQWVDKREFQSSIKSLGFRPMLERLYLNSRLLECLGAGGVPYRFSDSFDSFNSLTVLELSMLFNSIEEVACALCIIRSSPNLQMLSVWSNTNRILEAVTVFILAQETPDRYFNNLRWVDIRLSAFDEAQMEFIRYLLASASKLEEMVITCEFDVPSDGLSNLLQQSPRASPSAVVDLRLREE